MTRDTSETKEALDFAVLYAQQEFESNPPKVGEKIVSPTFPGILTILEIVPPFLRCTTMTDEDLSVAARDCYRLPIALRIATAELCLDILAPSINMNDILK